MMHQFKRGDRVVYHSSANAGRRDLDGYVGTVQRVDGTRLPYKVKFDRKISEPFEGNYWHCCEEHLSALRNDDDENKEDHTMGKPIWNKESDGVLRRMKEEGASAAQIAEALGLTVQQVYGRVSYMNGKKPSKEKAADEGNTSTATEAATLNPLEEAMKEQIMELTNEKEVMSARVCELETAYEDAATEKHALRAKCDILSDENEKLRERLEAAEAELKAVLDRETEDRREQAPALQEDTSVCARRPMTREGVLKAAISCVCGDRDEQYGSPEQSFDTIAALWNVYLHTIVPKCAPEMLSAPNVGVMMALFKIARIAGGRFKADSFIDACGYLACAYEIEDGYQFEE